MYAIKYAHMVSSLDWGAQIAKFMWPTWGPPGSCRPQVGPILSPGTFLSGRCTPHLEEDSEEEIIWSYFITDMVDFPSPWVSYIKSLVAREEYSIESSYMKHI